MSMAANELEIQTRSDRRWRWSLPAIFVLGIGAGLSSLSGQVLAGDDVLLVFGHPWVSRPSLLNAWNVLSHFHRDFYQPVPVLLFQLEFLLFGSRPGGFGLWGGQELVYIMHLNNVLLHGLNGALAVVLMRRLTGRPPISALVGAMFVLHPLAVETVAWINGRMMLTSSCCALATLISFHRWRERPTGVNVAMVIAFTALTMMCKVQVALPLLALLLPLLGRYKPDRRWWLLWSGALLLTVAFTVLNLKGTSRIAALSEAHGLFGGSRTARVALALGWYLQAYVWPSGLSPVYPSPPMVRWSDPEVIQSAIAILVACGIAIMAAWRRNWIGALGLAWFIVNIAPTLNIIAFRNILVADRYVYLAIIGLHWPVAAALCWTLATRAKPVAAPACLAMLTVWGVLFYRTSGYYESSIAKAKRVAEVFPDAAGVHVRLGEAYLGDGLAGPDTLTKALELANEEIAKHGDLPSVCSAYQLQGRALQAAGRWDEAEQAFRKAVEVLPDAPKAHAQLAGLLVRRQRMEDAVSEYRKTVELAPEYAWAQARLGALLAGLGRFEEAKAAFEQALRINPYEAGALMGLGELWLGANAPAKAEVYFRRLLDWMPEDATARTNLGLCLHLSGKPEQAAEQYRTALRDDPANPSAAMNLAAWLEESGRSRDAAHLFEKTLAAVDRASSAPPVAMDGDPESTFAGSPAESDAAGDSVLLALVERYSDFLLRHGQPDGAAKVWSWLLERRPDAPPVLAHAAWFDARIGQLDGAADKANRALQADPNQTLAHLALGMAALLQSDPERAADQFETAALHRPPQPPDAFDRGLSAMADYGQTHPDVPWSYYLAAVLLEAKGDHDAARQGFQEFLARCRDPQWRQRAQQRE